MKNGVSAPGPTRPGAPPIRLLTLIAAVLLVAGCGQQAGSPGAGRSTSAAASPAGTPTPADTPTPDTTAPADSAGAVALSPADRTACAQLLGHLQRVALAISASSELLTNALDKQQLSQRIGNEAAQLRKAADLMAQGPVPAPLANADRDLVDALRTLTGDFNRAKDAAGRGDLRATAVALTDRPAVQRIVAASKTIEDSCR